MTGEEVFHAGPVVFLTFDKIAAVASDMAVTHLPLPISRHPGPGATAAETIRGPEIWTSLCQRQDIFVSGFRVVTCLRQGTE